MLQVTLRDFRQEDAPACAEIFHRAWHSGHPYAPRSIDLTTFRAETADEAILVAELGPRIVGFTSVQCAGGFVHHLYVDPDHQRLGIGRKLLAEAVRLAGGSASLKCQIRNEGALLFYQRLGWQSEEEGEAAFGRWVRLRSM